MAVKIQGGSNTAGQANVSSEYELAVKPTTTVANAGVVVGAGDTGDATDAGGSYKRSMEVSQDWRLRVNQDRLLFSQTFGGGSQNGYYTFATTWTVNYANTNAGGLTLNNGASSAAGTAGIHSVRGFVVPMEGTYNFGCRVRFSIANATNHTFAFGIRSGSPTTQTIGDGIAVQLSNGELRIVNVNTSVTVAQTDALPFVFASNVTYNIVLSVSRQRAELWIDSEYVGALDLPAAESGVGYAGLPNSCMFILTSNSAGGSAVVTYVQDWSAYDASGATDGMPTSHLAAAALHAYPNAFSFAASTNLTNSIAIPTFALSNTSPPSTTTGGICSFAATASGNTHYVMWSTANDSQTTAQAAKTQYITGVRIDAINAGAANSGTVPTTLMFAVSGTNTAASLVTAEGQSSSASMAPRLQPVGVLQIPINAVIGQQAGSSINVQFATPVAVPVGSYAQIIMRILSGAATASQTITLVVGVDGYWA